MLPSRGRRASFLSQPACADVYRVAAQVLDSSSREHSARTAVDINRDNSALSYPNKKKSVQLNKEKHILQVVISFIRKKKIYNNKDEGINKAHKVNPQHTNGQCVHLDRERFSSRAINWARRIGGSDGNGVPQRHIQSHAIRVEEPFFSLLYGDLCMYIYLLSRAFIVSDGGARVLRSWVVFLLCTSALTGRRSTRIL